MRNDKNEIIHVSVCFFYAIRKILFWKHIKIFIVYPSLYLFFIMHVIISFPPLIIREKI